MTNSNTAEPAPQTLSADVEFTRVFDKLSKLLLNEQLEAIVGDYKRKVQSGASDDEMRRWIADISRNYGHPLVIGHAPCTKVISAYVLLPSHLPLTGSILLLGCSINKTCVK